MDNINNNITRFNGQYLKCIVSNYTSTKNYLGNSGSLIVIQPKSGKLNDIEWENAYKNGDIHRNYVYLGNEFLASGFGFACQEILEKAEHIINVYDDDIEGLRKKDKELDQKIDDKIEEVYNELEKYVKINGGRIENTVVSLNGQLIKTKDIILYGEEAQYKNLEVNDIKILVKIKNGKEIICEGDTIFLPIGSILDKINIELEISKNDSGGISDLEVLHYTNDENYEGVKIKYDLDSDILINEDYDIYRLYYEKQLSEDDSFIIDSYKPEILKSVYIYVKATPEAAYKYYPGIYRKYNIKITSIGNAIVDNILNLHKIVNVRPQYYLKYSENGILDDSDFTGYLPLNSFNDYDKTTLTFNITSNMNQKYIYFALPNNFSINKIYLLRNHSEKYNWTGAVNIIRNKKMKCVGNESYYISYDVYILYAENGFLDNSSIELCINYNYVKDNIHIDNEYTIYNKPRKLEDFDQTDTFLNMNDVDTLYDTLNDEDFNDLYWINYKTNYNENYNELTNKLNNVSINCVR